MNLALTAAGLSVLAWSAFSSGPAGALARLLFLAAQMWSISLLALRALLFRGAPPPPVTVGQRPTVTTLIVAGDELEASVLAAVAVAQAVGPVVLVDTAEIDRTGMAASLGITYVAPGNPDPVAAGFAAIWTDATLLVRPSAVVHTIEVARAASRLGDGVQWVTGRSRAFNADAFDPMAKRPLAARLRAGARRQGAAVWETDATIVDTEAARAAGGLTTDRPSDELLRAMAAAGGHGAVHDVEIVRVSAPASAPAFWRDVVPQRRATLRACLRGLTTGAGRARLASFALAVQILGGLGGLLWLLTGFAVAVGGESPVDATVPIGVALLAVAAARVAMRVAQAGNHADPGRLGIASVYDSVAGLAAAVGRPGAKRAGGRTGMLLAAAGGALLGEALLAFALGLRDGGPLVRWVVVGVCTVWAALVGKAIARARGMATAARLSFRFPVQMTAEVDERLARTVDVSPGGMRLRGLGGTPEIGRPLTGTVWSPQGEVVYFSGRVAHTTGSGRETEVGIALDLPMPALAAWTRVIFSAAGITASAE